jgi:hypothetical protein
MLRAESEVQRPLKDFGPLLWKVLHCPLLVPSLHPDPGCLEHLWTPLHLRHFNKGKLHFQTRGLHVLKNHQTVLRIQAPCLAKNRKTLDGFRLH